MEITFFCQRPRAVINRNYYWTIDWVLHSTWTDVVSSVFSHELFSTRIQLIRDDKYFSFQSRGSCLKGTNSSKSCHNRFMNENDVYRRNSDILGKIFWKIINFTWWWTNGDPIQWWRNFWIDNDLMTEVIVR